MHVKSMSLGETGTLLAQWQWQVLSNVRSAVAIAEVKYPKDLYDILWVFDQSSNHTAWSDDA